MEINGKKNGNKDYEFLSVEGSNSFDMNKLPNVKSIGSVYFLNKENNVLTRKSETELKQFFTKSKDELISVLKQITEINKADFREENQQLIKSLIPDELQKLLNLDENKYIITFEGNVNELPENSETGKIYGLIGEDNKITYYLYLKDNYVILADKSYYEENFYNKNEVNLKLLDLNSKLNVILSSLESTINNTISKSEFNEFITKMNLIKNEINELKAFLNI